MEKITTRNGGGPKESGRRRAYWPEIDGFEETPVYYLDAVTVPGYRLLGPHSWRLPRSCYRGSGTARVTPTARTSPGGQGGGWRPSRYGRGWFGLLARRCWRKISSEELARTLAATKEGGHQDALFPLGTVVATPGVLERFRTRRNDHPRSLAVSVVSCSQVNVVISPTRHDLRS
jgi:hypothetical protein